MVVELDAGEFPLPTEFFNDGFFMEDNHSVAMEGKFLRAGSVSCIPQSFQSESSTEFEIGEKEHIAGLTRRMAHSYLYEDDDDMLSSRSKVLDMEDLQQRVLSHARMCSVFSGGDSKCVTKMSLSASPSPVQRGREWDFLSAASGELARMRQMENKFNGCRIPKPSSPANFTYARLMNNTPPTHQQAQALQFYKLKQHQLIKQQEAAARILQSRSVWSGRSNMRTSMASPALLSQLPRSGLRNVTLHSPVSRRPCAGTGVFLPKQAASPSEPLKKPARSLQTLKLKHDDTDDLRRYRPLEYEPRLAEENASLASKKWNQQQYRHYRSPLPSPPPAVTSREILLPTEWPYSCIN